MWPADRADAQLDRIVGAGLRDQRRRFRLAVADRDFAGAHFLRDALHHLDRARAAGHDAGPQRRQISPRIVFVLEHGDEHRGHAVERGAALLFDGRQRRAGLKAFGRKHHRRAVNHAAQRSQHAAEAVVQRHGQADAVRVIEPLALAGVERVEQNIAMREHRALRAARWCRTCIEC